MKLTLFLLFFSQSIFATSLYFTSTFYKDTEKKPITTKQHMFLDQAYVVRYWNMDYILTLKKAEKDFIKIEHETYFTTPGKKQFLSAGIWSGKLTDKMELKQFSPGGKLKFKLTVTPTKIQEKDL